MLTDFGFQDTYVGVMKGVVASIAPQSQVIDLTHGIPPGDIRQAAFKLWQAVPFFPEGTIFVAVVDPGVGTGRRAPLACVSIDAREQYFPRPRHLRPGRSAPRPGSCIG